MIKKIVVLLVFLSVVSCDNILPETLKVEKCSPSYNETGVSSDRTIVLEFSSSVNKQDVEESFNVSNSQSSVEGSFNWRNSKSFEFIPDDPMEAKGRYVILLPRSVRDEDGNVMSQDFISEFYIGDDFTAPSVTISVPPFSSSAVTGISVSQNLIINFSKTMDKASVEENFSVSPSISGYFLWGESVPGLSDSQLTYVLLENMDYGKLYTMKISSDAEDINGNKPGVDYIVNFITGDDFTPPDFTGFFDPLDISPDPYWDEAALNEGKSRDIQIAMRFNEAMDRISVEDSFSVTPSVSGTFKWNDDMNVVFIPTEKLDCEKTYFVKLDKNAKDIHGLNLENSHSCEFRTNAPDSLNVTCTFISGGPWTSDCSDYVDVTFSLLDTGLWPVPITMDDEADDTLRTQIYCVKFEFSSDMNKYSIYDNYLIETIKSIPSSIDPGNAVVDSIRWIDNRTVILKIGNMTNDLDHTPALYRLSISGGKNGIADINGNYMSQDLVFEMKEMP